MSESRLGDAHRLLHPATGAGARPARPVETLPVIDDPEVPPVGVFPLGDGRATWRTWAPNAKTVDLVVREGGAERTIPMRSLARGFFEAEANLGGPELRYGYRLDGEEPRADPVSRRQPEGIRGLSAVWIAEGPPHGPEVVWKGIAPPTSSSTSCTSAPSRPRGPSTRSSPGSTPCSTWGSPRSS